MSLAAARRVQWTRDCCQRRRRHLPVHGKADQVDWVYLSVIIASKIAQPEAGRSVFRADPPGHHRAGQEVLRFARKTPRNLPDLHLGRLVIGIIWLCCTCLFFLPEKRKGLRVASQGDDPSKPPFFRSRAVGRSHPDARAGPVAEGKPGPLPGRA